MDLIGAILAGSCLLVAAGPGAAEGWPERPVKIVTLAGAGGGSDAVARSIADALSRAWGKPVVVENRPGADGIIAIDAFLGAHDGHTLLFGSTGIVTANPLLHARLSYDPAADLVPIGLAVEDHIAIVAAPQLPAKLSDLIGLARTRSDALNYATVPGPPALFVQALQAAAQVHMELVPYRNPLAAIQDLMESRIDVAMMPVASVASLAESHRLSIVAVTSPDRAAIVPTVPTVAEEGFADLAFTGGLGLFAPRDMPESLRTQIAADLAQVLAQPALRQKLETLGYRVRAEGPEPFAELLRVQSDRWRTIVGAYHLSPAN